MAELDTGCSPRYILQNIEALKNKPSQIDYLKDTMQRCAITPSPVKKKRKLSGYNCFIKVAIKKTGKPLKEVVKAKTWSTLEARQKLHWTNLANEGCNNPRLWE